MDKPNAPDGLGAAGVRLWDGIVNVYELFPAELTLLAAACRTVDELEMIELAMADAPVVVVGSTGQPKVSGLFAEARAHRLVLGKLVEQLALPEPDEDEGKTPAQERASKAAQARWALERARRGSA